MDKQRSIAAAAETDEDRLLLARIYDKLTHAADREIFGCTGFLSPREQALTRRLLPHLPLVFFGGCEGAERCMACYVPEYLPEDYLSSPDGPAAAVRAAYYEKDTLTHRDFLGSLMGAGIKRETVGDIYVSEGQCDFLVTRQALRDTVHSLRLDCLVGAAFSMARGPAAQLIAAGRVAVNDLVCLKGDRIAVRGFGKAELSTVGGTTRKGRISIVLSLFL